MAQKTTCSKCGNQVEESRKGQRYCIACHSHYVRSRRPGYEPLSDKTEEQKRDCREIARRRVKSGVLVKERCYNCRSEDVEAHHSDYSQPLKVHWLCFDCHRELHKNKSLRRRIHAMPPTVIYWDKHSHNPETGKIKRLPDPNKRTYKMVKEFLKDKYG